MPVARRDVTDTNYDILLGELPDDQRLILPALQHIQEALGYVPEPAIDAVASFLNVSRADVHGVLTYYHDLRRELPAPIVVAICTAEACQANGSRTLVDDVTRRIAPMGGRSADGNVEVKEIFCLGNCALGPAAFINERLIGRVDVDMLERHIEHSRSELTP